MPKATYTSLGLENLRGTSVVIQLADRSIRKPFGLLEDILVRVKNLVFPVDFYVLDMTHESREEKSLILGRPFMRTANAVVSLKDGTITMQVENQVIEFKVFEARKHPLKDKSLLSLHVVDNVVDEIEDTLRLTLIDNVDSHMCTIDAFASVIDNAFLLDSKKETPNIRSMMYYCVDPWHVKYNFGGVCICISSVPIHNPLEKGSLFNVIDKDRLGRMVDLMMDEGLLWEKDH